MASAPMAVWVLTIFFFCCVMKRIVVWQVQAELAENVEWCYLCQCANHITNCAQCWRSSLDTITNRRVKKVQEGGPLECQKESRVQILINGVKHLPKLVSKYTEQVQELLLRTVDYRRQTFILTNENNSHQYSQTHIICFWWPRMWLSYKLHNRTQVHMSWPIYCI